MGARRLKSVTTARVISKRAGTDPNGSIKLAMAAPFMVGFCFWIANALHIADNSSMSVGGALNHYWQFAVFGLAVSYVCWFVYRVQDKK